MTISTQTSHGLERHETKTCRYPDPPDAAPCLGSYPDPPHGKALGLGPCSDSCGAGCIDPDPARETARFHQADAEGDIPLFGRIGVPKPRD